MFSRFARLLLKRVKDVDGFIEFGDVNNSKLVSSVNTDLADAGANRTHWFRIRWLESALHSIQLIPSLLACWIRESADGLQRRTAPFEWLHAQALYNKLYTDCRCFCRRQNFFFQQKFNDP